MLKPVKIMKKRLLPILFSLLAAISVRADLIWYESFNYVDGNIPVVGTNSSGQPLWFRQSGSQNDALVRDHKLEISTSGTGLARTDDVNRKLCTTGGCSYTNVAQVLFSSFTVNFTNLPTANGAYFAHFLINDTTFPCRIWALTGNPTGTSNVFSALPGTFRIGIAGGSQANPSRIFPVDLATNTSYQVVAEWDPVTLQAARLWINPISSGDVNTTYTSDTVGINVTPPTAFGTRQATGFGGFLTVSNMSVATTFDEAATNVWSTAPVPPAIVYQPQNVTNFEGTSVILSLVAAGQSLGNLTYQWVKNGSNIPNPDGNTNVYAIASLTAGAAGQYRVVVANPTTGLSVTSQVANVVVDPRAIAPFFVVPPKNTTNYFGTTATLTAAAAGPQPISYNWTFNGGAITSPNVSGADTPTLTITEVQTNNGTMGTYTVVATNPNGPSTNASAFLAAISPPVVSIAFLRTLVDPVNYLATNSTALWQATGTVTTFTNLTTGNTSSYYMQDGTAGINIFVTFGTTFRPALGDIVTFVGVLSSFNSTLELLVNKDPATGIPGTTNYIVSSGSPLPAPKVIPFNITNSLAQAEALEGTEVMLTNVFFGTNAGNTISTNANATVVVTNGRGETFNLFFSSQDTDTAGQTLPSFAWTVRGVMAQNLANATVPRNQLYNVTVTRFSDIVTDAPPAVTTAVSASGNNRNVTWMAVPYNYSYSILTATNVAGPYAPESTFQATMLGINEVPANGSTGTGFGTLALSPDQTTITVNMRFSGLSAPANAAHIHGPGGAGTNASVLFGPFTGVPAATSGAMPEQSFPITPTQIGYLTNGFLYMNVHNTNFPGGELRGQLFLVPSVGKTFTTGNGIYTDVNGAGARKYYRVTSP